MTRYDSREMLWLSSSTLARLRDQLRDNAQRPSFAHGDPSRLTAESAELLTVTNEYGSICEAMYLMMSADGTVGREEREVLKGALRNLSGDTVRGVYIEAMLDEAAKRIAEHGRDARLKDVMNTLREDEARAEVTFVLGAAIAFADNAIANEENETMSAFAEGLGISEERAEDLLVEVEADLRQRKE